MKEKKEKFSEKQVDNFFVARVKKVKGQAFKLESPYFTGFPDRTVLLPQGIVFFVEMKSSVGKLSPRQVVAHKLIRALGLRVYVLNDKAGAQEIIDNEIAMNGLW